MTPGTVKAYCRIMHLASTDLSTAMREEGGEYAGKIAAKISDALTEVGREMGSFAVVHLGLCPLHTGLDSVALLLTVVARKT